MVSASEAWAAFWRITNVSFHVVLDLWPVSLGVLVAAILAFTVGNPLRTPAIRRRLTLLLITYAIPLLIVVMGAVLRFPGPPRMFTEARQSWRVDMLWWVLLIHALVVLAAPILMKGVRLRAFAILLLGFWLSVTSGFLVEASLQGVGQ